MKRLAMGVAKKKNRIKTSDRTKTFPKIKTVFKYIESRLVVHNKKKLRLLLMTN